jgi:hypothetical protein
VGPFAVKQALNNLKEAHCISVMIDSSNPLNLKLLLHLIKYYCPGKCVMVKAVELVSLGGKSSDLLSSCVLELFKKFEPDDKVIAISADNTNTYLWNE